MESQEKSLIRGRMRRVTHQSSESKSYHFGRKQCAKYAKDTPLMHPGTCSTKRTSANALVTTRDFNFRPNEPKQTKAFGPSMNQACTKTFGNAQCQKLKLHSRFTAEDVQEFLKLREKRKQEQADQSKRNSTSKYLHNELRFN